MVKIRAKAKLNLFLEVVRRRPDGYHELATLFARIGLSDSLTLRKTSRGGIKLRITGEAEGITKQSDNIVFKAAAAFFAAFKIKPAVVITLKKNIPAGAGLGGGSSDGAATLLGLGRLYNIRRERFQRLMEIASALGSDVPFFMLDEIFAEGRGRGEKLKILRFKGRLPHVVLVYPGIPVYTKEAYACLKPGTVVDIRARLKDFSRLCSSIKRGNWVPGNDGLLFNRLEEPVLPRHKAVRLAKERLLKSGADAVLMSGSGACVFGLCRSKARAACLARAISSVRGYRVFLTRFC